MEKPKPFCPLTLGLGDEKVTSTLYKQLSSLLETSYGGGLLTVWINKLWYLPSDFMLPKNVWAEIINTTLLRGQG